MQATITLPADELDATIRTMVRETVAEMMATKEKQNEGPDFLNLGQAADFIHVSRGTLAKIIKSGAIKVSFVGNAKRISRKQLVQYMASQEV